MESIILCAFLGGYGFINYGSEESVYQLWEFPSGSFGGSLMQMITPSAGGNNYLFPFLFVYFDSHSPFCPIVPARTSITILDKAD